MFEVVALLRRGWWRDRVEIRAVTALTHRRMRLRRWNDVGVREDEISIAAGESFAVRLPAGSAFPGMRVAIEKVQYDRAFRGRWVPVLIF